MEENNQSELKENNNLNIRKINSSKKNINKSNTNRNFTKLKNINSETSLSNHFKKDSYCNSIENKRKFLGLDYKSNIKKELSIQTEQNSEKKNRLIQRIKNEKKLKLCNLYERDKLIKVKKREIKVDNIRNLIKNRTVTNFNREKNKMSLSARNNGIEKYNKNTNYHIYI